MLTTHFKIAIPEQDIQQLHTRLERARWPDEEGSAWEMGTSLEYMRNLIQYWRNDFNWLSRQSDLNELSHYRAVVRGINLHFVHERATRAAAVPLLLLHGWPDSFLRYRKLAPLLSKNTGESFHVVIPSHPGFGFSQRTASDSFATAQLYVDLMAGLGYERFVVVGGDIGAFIAMALANIAPDKLLGMHLTEVGYPDETTDVAELTRDEQEFAAYIKNWWITEGAYNLVQSTKPQSLGFALNDSPLGLAAWIMSFVSMGTTSKLAERLSLDDLLTNICLYWFTQTAASSMRVYYRNAQAMRSHPTPATRIDVPTAVAHMPWDAPLPRAWAERRMNVVQFTEMPRGGHFGAWELPQEFAADLRRFIGSLS